MLVRARNHLGELLWLLPLGSLAAWIAVQAYRIPSLVPAIVNSDSVGPMVIAESLHHLPPHTAVTMASEGNYTTLALDVLTRELPAHHHVWQALPVVMEVAGVALLAWTVHRLAGWRAAVVSLAIAVATSPLLLTPLLSQAYHNTTYLNVFVLAALLVAMGLAANPLARHRLALYGAVALLSGVDLASDHLFGFVGLIPFVVAPALVACHRRDRATTQVLAAAAGVAVVSVVVARMTVQIASHIGLHYAAVPAHIASPNRMASNVLLLRDDLVAMANGSLSAPTDGVGLLRLVCAALLIGAVLVPLVMLARVALRGRLGSSTEQSQPDFARSLFAAFWGVSALMLIAGFVLSDLPFSAASIRYLPPVLYAVAAAVPLLVVRGGVVRRVLAGSAVALATAYGALVFLTTPASVFGSVEHLASLESWLEVHHLHHGYAGYWQADAITWMSDGRVESRAVGQSAACGADENGWFCPYPTNSVTSWYRGVPGPSFFVSDSVHREYFPQPFPSSWRPVQVVRFDDFTIYVFDHDIGVDAAAHTTAWRADLSGSVATP